MKEAYIIVYIIKILVFQYYIWYIFDKIQKEIFEMLIDEVISFSDKKYQAYGANGNCGNCNHPSGKCSGSCYQCLYDIHYSEADKGKICKRLYDCERMLYHYVCQYSYVYASEILYAYRAHAGFLSEFEKFNLLSIACGGCPDLMALEKFRNEYKLEKEIAYKGIDINRNWSNIHSCIKIYCDSNAIKRSFFSEDVFSVFKENYSAGANIYVMSYFVSYLYNAKKQSEIHSFFANIARGIRLGKRGKVLVIINDLNSNRKGRDFIIAFPNSLKQEGLTYKVFYRYFDKPSLWSGQRYGEGYTSSTVLFPENSRIAEKYHSSRYNTCGSYQLIVEID